MFFFFFKWPWYFSELIYFLLLFQWSLLPGPSLKYRYHNLINLSSCLQPLPDDLLCVDSLPGFRSTLPCFLESRKFLSELQQLEQYETLLNDGNDQLLRLEAERLETLFNADLDVTTIKSITQTEKELRSNTFQSSPKPSGSLYWRQQVNNTTPSKKRGGRYYSFKLGDIYHALLNKTPVSHRAENDVMNMLECIHVIGTPFVEWMDDNCIAFKNIRLYCWWILGSFHQGCLI